MESRDIELLSNKNIPESVRATIAEKILSANDIAEGRAIERQKLALEGRGQRWNTPLVAALASLVTLSATYFFDRLTRVDQSRNQITLAQVQAALETSEVRLRQQLDEATAATVAAREADSKEREFQYEVIEKELSDRYKSNKDRAAVLLFLVRAGVLKKLNFDELQKMAEEQQKSPYEQIIPQLQPSSDGPVDFDGKCRNSRTFADLQDEYSRLFYTMTIEDPSFAASVLTKIEAQRPRYEVIQESAGVPWWFIALVHYAESGSDFSTHLINGDPLTSRTIHVPVGRPTAGAPPFSWEESALDAIGVEGLKGLEDWSLERSLYRLEAYNGFGYRKRGVCSPYLWAGTNHYSSGAFVGDGVFDPKGVTNRIGLAVLLRMLFDKGAILSDVSSTDN